MPITWRNVSNPAGLDLVGARLFEQSREAVGDGLDGIRQMFAAQKVNEQAAWQQGKINNTEDFKDKLARAKTPEELAALEASGALDGSAFGAQIDRGVVRDGVENRLDALNNIFLKNTEADNARREVADSPIIAKYQAQMYGLNPDTQEGNTAGVGVLEAARAAGLSDQGLANLSKMFYDKTNLDIKNKDAHNQSVASVAASQASTANSVYNLGRNKIVAGRDDAAYERSEGERQQLNLGTAEADALASQLVQANPDAGSLPIDQINAARENLRASYASATPEIRDQIVSSFGDRIKKLRELSPQAQAVLDAENAPLIQAGKISQDQLDARYAAENANNPFVKVDVSDPEATTANILKEVDPTGDWNGGEYARIVNKGKELMGAEKYYTITDAEGKKSKVKIQITPGMVKEVLTKMNTSWHLKNIGYEDSLLEEGIKEMITSPGFYKRYLDADQIHAKYVQDSSDLQSTLAAQGKANLTKVLKLQRGEK